MLELPSDDSPMGRILTACKPEGRLCIAEVDGKLYLRAYGFMAYWKASYFKDFLITTPSEDAKREADRIVRIVNEEMLAEKQEYGFIERLARHYEKKGKRL